jgi:undecaprenyl-diphosphatase
MLNSPKSRTGLAAVLARWSRIEPLTLMAIAVPAAIVLAFATLGRAVGAGSTRAFDEAILLAMRTPGNPADPVGPLWFQEMVRDFTALGSTGVLTFMVLSIAGFLVMTRKGHAAAFVILSVGGGVLISETMKALYARARPDLVPHAAEVYSASFPSGHSMMSAVVYLTLGALVARSQANRAVKRYIVTLAVILAILVGLSRIYLGVHWPTDVLAGWALGGAWALVCWFVMTWLQSRGEVEPETNGSGAAS